MLLILIRHGIAAPLGAGRASDKERPLTTKGAERFRLVAQALARLLPRPSAILTSPLLRARQTADIAAQAWGGPPPRTHPALATGDWPGVVKAMADHGKDDMVVLVGHENWISEVTARLLGGDSGGCFRYRKGGVAAIEIADTKAVAGRLLWFVPPKMWRRS